MSKIESKKKQKLHAEHLKKLFDKISEGQDQIPVVLDRASWEALHYTIGLALKLSYKKEKKHGKA